MAYLSAKPFWHRVLEPGQNQPVPEQPGDGDSDAMTWNFEKFSVDRDGQVAVRWAPPTTPEEIGEALPNWLG